MRIYYVFYNNTHIEYYLFFLSIFYRESCVRLHQFENIRKIENKNGFYIVQAHVRKIIINLVKKINNGKKYPYCYTYPLLSSL